MAKLMNRVNEKDVGKMIGMDEKKRDRERKVREKVDERFVLINPFVPFLVRACACCCMSAGISFPIVL